MRARSVLEVRLIRRTRRFFVDADQATFYDNGVSHSFFSTPLWQGRCSLHPTRNTSVQHSTAQGQTAKDGYLSSMSSFDSTQPIHRTGHFRYSVHKAFPILRGSQRTSDTTRRFACNYLNRGLWRCIIAPRDRALSELPVTVLGMIQ